MQTPLIKNVIFSGFSWWGQAGCYWLVGILLQNAKAVCQIQVGSIEVSERSIMVDYDRSERQMSKTQSTRSDPNVSVTSYNNVTNTNCAPSVWSYIQSIACSNVSMKKNTNATYWYETKIQPLPRFSGPSNAETEVPFSAHVTISYCWGFKCYSGNKQLKILI